MCLQYYTRTHKHILYEKKYIIYKDTFVCDMNKYTISDDGVWYVMYTLRVREGEGGATMIHSEFITLAVVKLGE